MIYSLLAIPLIGVLFTGYGKIKVASYFGLNIFLSAISILFSYLVFDLQAALMQLATLAVGTIVFLTGVQILHDKFSYRSPLLLMSSIGLLPVGLLTSFSYMTPLIVFGIIMSLNVIFAILIFQFRKNSLSQKKPGTEVPKPRYVLASPTVLASLTVGLMVLAYFSENGML